MFSLFTKQEMRPLNLVSDIMIIWWNYDYIYKYIKDRKKWKRIKLNITIDRLKLLPNPFIKLFEKRVHLIDKSTSDSVRSKRSAID